MLERQFDLTKGVWKTFLNFFPAVLVGKETPRRRIIALTPIKAARE
jgi:hypothetical protein